MKKIFIFLLLFCLYNAQAQQSPARKWNEVLLDAIRGDYARPTIHARNIYHSTILMYDSWAIFDAAAETIFLGKNYGKFNCRFDGIQQPTNILAARQEMMSYALFRLLMHRFKDSPKAEISINNISALFSSYGYNSEFTSTNYSNGSYAALGNHLGQQMIAFGLQDGANETLEYGNNFYQPSNPPLVLAEYQDPTNINPNRWQPLSFELFIDQSGNSVPVSIPTFLSPEWGSVVPFALKQSAVSIKNNGFDSYLYYDMPQPPSIQNSPHTGIDDPYKWHFTLVAAWSAHLDPDDYTEIDISPASLGNVSLDNYPSSFEEYKTFYDFMDGGDIGTGRTINPKTNLPYTPQLVKRSDYARVLAEFWADGPDSETPPGHWFTILNYVNDHPELSKRFGGVGREMNDLEWDVKAYLALAGAMHDSAIATWGIKGYFDYIRPISAIRYMASKGQSSDPDLPSFDPHGIPLVPGLIEIIGTSDPLVGDAGENVGKIKVYSWKGPDYINDPATDTAGVGWILGTHWWPYQRGTFVTPPFAGFVSGHSTFSRAASEVLTLLTGDPFFPGGMGTFDIKANNFLVFEQGPTTDITLQWATYRDASDQTSLSRIWGGIHPPIDDIPGRLMGDKIGRQAFTKAQELFNAKNLENDAEEEIILFPLPFKQQVNIQTDFQGKCTINLYELDGRLALFKNMELGSSTTSIDLSSISTGLYVLVVIDDNGTIIHQQKIIKN